MRLLVIFLSAGLMTERSGMAKDLVVRVMEGKVLDDSGKPVEDAVVEWGS
jgi:protocatechuate 3,4-dioxygenase beta subunit